MSIWNNTTLDLIESLNRDNMSEKEFFEMEIAAWRCGKKRKQMIDGERYFRGEHDILNEVRSAIGRDGKLKKVENLPNNRIVDNQYQRLVNQKVNYLLGREIMIEGKNDVYISLLKKTLGKEFGRTLKCLLRDAINMGIAWLYAYADERGELRFKRIPSYEVIPYWKDDDHTVLDHVLRCYSVEGYKGKKECVWQMAEIYSARGVEIYDIDEGILKKVGESGYFTTGKIPMIAFKYNEKEIPLISRVKSLQDALNKTLSDFENRLQEDARNTILVLQNYDGTDLGEFRQNLATYGAVKVKSIDGAPGDIKTLTTEVNSDNYAVVASMLKSSIIENGMGYDPKNDRIGNNPNQMVIKSMYSDLDLDISEAEVEFKYSFEKLREIVNEFFEVYGKGYFEGEEADIIFNRDVLINEGEAIDNCIKSRDILSDETIVLQHPWVKDVKEEMNKRSMKNG